MKNYNFFLNYITVKLKEVIKYQILLKYPNS
jgi:hypothetical protein